jgi:UDP-2-acetamido-3-amino-2,3-dideoxy-glucuronate N-acetyltransferase
LRDDWSWKVLDSNNQAATKNYFVHESSYIDEGVVIGAGTKIWHFCHVLGNVGIGADCSIGQNVVIGPAVTIHNRVKIQNNVSVFQGVVLEDEVFCGPSMVFTNVGTPRAGFPRNQPEDFLPTIVKKGASIGANATIICGNTIGQYAMIGAGSVVTKEVPPFALVYGNPARQRGWVCMCGVPLSLATNAERAKCAECSRRYQLFSGSELRIDSADELIDRV